jgi:histidine kinase
MILLKTKTLALGYVLKDILYISLCSVLIAVVFILVTSNAFTTNIFIEYFLIAQCMGLSIGIPCTYAFYFFKPETPVTQLTLLTVCIVSGALLGTILASQIVDSKFPLLDGHIPIQMFIVAVILGFVISFVFVMYDNYATFKISAKDEKLKRVSIEKDKLNSDLKLLQAQVEPHFLFNTLSNILSLIDSDTPKGKKMLENLTQYLRTSLIQSRKPHNRLSDEIDMITNYLDIFKIRMDKRLSYEINIPDEVLAIYIPPMLIQPLVENAIKHGLEPKIDGGKINIRAQLKNGKLFIEIADTGMGIQENSNPGVGTGNIKKRLEALYGNNACISFEDVIPQGLKAIVEIPYEADHSHNR